jgi:hypothetical protein
VVHRQGLRRLICIRTRSESPTAGRCKYQGSNRKKKARASSPAFFVGIMRVEHILL